MPYYRKNTKKTGYKRYNKKVNSFTPKVKRVLYSIAEKKHVEFGNTAQSIPNTWAINALHCSTTAAGTDAVGSGIVQGAGYNQRVGERVRINALKICLHLYPTSAATMPAAGMTCRFIIFQDKMPNLGYPAVSDVLEDTGFLNSQYNLTKRDRFKILKDFVHQQVPTISSATVPLGGGPQSLTQMNFYPKVEMEYTGTTGVTAAVFKQGFFILARCSANNCTTMEWRNQIEFLDQ